MRNQREFYKKQMLKESADNQLVLNKKLTDEISTLNISITELSNTVLELSTTVEDLSKLVTATVTFNSDGGSSVQSQIVTYNTTATEPDDPTKENYVFVGWFKGISETEFDFTTKIKENTILTAHWEESEQENPADTE